MKQNIKEEIPLSSEIFKGIHEKVFPNKLKVEIKPKGEKLSKFKESLIKKIEK